MASDRRLGCLSIFLFIALCASLFVNFVLMIAAFQRVGGIGKRNRFRVFARSCSKEVPARPRTKSQLSPCAA